MLPIKLRFVNSDKWNDLFETFIYEKNKFSSMWCSGIFHNGTMHFSHFLVKLKSFTTYKSWLRVKYLAVLFQWITRLWEWWYRSKLQCSRGACSHSLWWGRGLEGGVTSPFSRADAPHPSYWEVVSPLQQEHQLQVRLHWSIQSYFFLLW